MSRYLFVSGFVLVGCSTYRTNIHTHAGQRAAYQETDASIPAYLIRTESDASLPMGGDSSLLPNTRVVDIAVGSGAACVLLETGRVSCFGDPQSAELGTARQTRLCELHPIDSAPSVRELRTGGSFFCVRSVDDSIACWGDNHALACGILNRPTVNTPTQLGAIRGRSLVLSSAGGCVIHETNLVYCWGTIPDLANRDTAEIARPTALFDAEESRQVLFPGTPLCVQRPDRAVRCFPRNVGEERRLAAWLSTVPFPMRDSLTFGTNALCVADQREVRTAFVSGDSRSLAMPNAVAVGCSDATTCGLSRDYLRCVHDGAVSQYAISGASVLGVGNGVACVWGETVGLVCVELQHRDWLSEVCQARQTDRGMFVILPPAR